MALNSISASTDTQTPPATGVVNIGKQSYSGADIKLMIYSNHPTVVEQAKARKLQNLRALDTEKIRQLAVLNGQLEQWKLSLISLNDYKVRNPGSTIDSRIAATEASMIKISQQIADLQGGLDSDILDPPQTNTKKIDKVLIPLATVASISISAYREKVPVRAFGFIAPKGYTRGSRTVAGSVVFVQFDEHALVDFLKYPPSAWGDQMNDGNRKSLSQIDQLPPMIVVAQFANEYGSVSELTIYGVEFIDDGMTLSIEDLFTENTCTYVARDYNILLKRGDANLSVGGSGEIQNTSASSLIRGLNEDKDYQNFMMSHNVSRRNPYI